MTVVPFETAGAFHAGTPRPLFKVNRSVATTPTRSYDVYPDGQHFLMVTSDSDPGPPVTRLELVLNWFEELKRRVPPGK